MPDSERPRASTMSDRPPPTADRVVGVDADIAEKSAARSAFKPTLGFDHDSDVRLWQRCFGVDKDNLLQHTRQHNKLRRACPPPPHRCCTTRSIALLLQCCSAHISF